MFGLFKRRSDNGDSKPSLEAIRFDTTGFSGQGEPQPGKVHVWRTPEGDGLGVYFFPVQPDLPLNQISVNALADLYCQLIGDAGGKLVDVAVLTACGGQTVRTILSLPQQPSARIHVGSLTVPFCDFSFVIKCQCAEAEQTGLKEAPLFDRSNAANERMQIDGERFEFSDWNPDDERHDAELPDHPVARVPRVLTHVLVRWWSRKR